MLSTNAFAIEIVCTAATRYAVRQHGPNGWPDRRDRFAQPFSGETGLGGGGNRNEDSLDDSSDGGSTVWLANGSRRQLARTCARVRSP